MEVSRRLLLFLFVFSSLLAFIGAFLKITHAGFNDLFLEVSIIMALLFSILCVIHIVRSKYLNKNLKWLYALLVLLIPNIGGLIYLIRESSREERGLF